MKAIRLLLTVSSLATFSGQATAQVASDQASSGRSEPAQTAELEDIIVTASRRSESIRDVPTAISAFSEERLRDTQTASLNNLAAITPNVQISSYLTNANINIRGVGNGNFISAGGDPGVAVHKNGVYLGQSALALSTFLDVERVEILRGPQGTLFGRNATGGAVNLIPNAPTTRLSYGIDVAAGIDPATVRSSTFVSGPLDGAGTLTARISATQNYNRGYTQNLSGEGPSRLDANDDFAFRGQLQWRPTEGLNVRLLAEYAKADDAGPAAFLLGTPTGGPIVFPDPLGAIVLPAGFPTGNPYRREAYANVGFRKLEYKTIDLTVDWTVGGGNLKLLGSYNESGNSIGQDGDGTAVPFTATFFTNRADQWFVEAIYTSDPARPFSYVLGANFYNEDVAQDILIPTSGFTTLFPTYTAGGTVDTRSFGVFARGEYAFSPATKAFAGLRYSGDRKEATEFFNLRPVFAPGLPADNADQRSWDRLTYEAGLSHEFSRSATGYAKYATGYKSGGYSVSSFNPPFDPETNESFELGLKGAFLDGALQANIASFYMKYDNLQVNQVQGLISAVTNAARATVYGVEVESVIRPVPGFRIEANGSWLRARFDEFTTLDSARPQLGTLDLTGNTLPGAPDFSAGVGAFADLPVSGGTVTPGARYTWRDRIFFSEFNLPVSSQDSIGKLDLFLNYKSADDRWSASIFALNITDEAVRANVVVVSALLGSLALAQYQPGRQVGVSVGYRF